jgi:hypothetical protein
LALQFLPANRHKGFGAAHGNILFDKKIPLVRTVPTTDQSEHIF